MCELESLINKVKASVVVITEVHRQNPELLEIIDYNSFAKLHPDDHPLEKTGGGVVITCIIKLKQD